MKITVPEEQHNIEIHENYLRWHKKPLLQKIYHDFYTTIKAQLNENIEGNIIELGSGIGQIKNVIPQAICTDIFNNPWIDKVESAYNLSFNNESVSNLILFDVFHHLKFPGNALAEFHRVLKHEGRVIILEPSLSLLGLLIYGLFHHEPIGLMKNIQWSNNELNEKDLNAYYAAQGNATRVFWSKKYKKQLEDWKLIKLKKLSAITYVLSGGYSKVQLYPDFLYSSIKNIESILDSLPLLFATRLLVVLEKK